MEPEETQVEKIVETVISILKETDLEEATEQKVRATAADRLGIDLSDLDLKWVVRRCVESYLLSLDEDEEEEDKFDEQQHQRPKQNERRLICKLSEKRGVTVHDLRGKALVSFRDYRLKGGKLRPSPEGITLSNKQWSAFRRSVPDIEAAITKMESRISYKYAGKQTKDSTAAFAQVLIPMETKEIEAEISNPLTAFAPLGIISMETKQIEEDISNETKHIEADVSNPVIAASPKGVIPMDTKLIETDISNSEASPPQCVIPMKAKQAQADILTLVTVSSPQGANPMETNQIETDVSNSVTGAAPHGLVSTVTKQIEADVTSSVTTSAPQGVIPMETKQVEANISNVVSAFAPHGLFPTMTTRLDGRNYHCWVHEVELFLKRLKVAYVLTMGCPSIDVGPEASFKEIAQAKAAEQKWVDDDYICRRSILCSLSDHLFDQYSKKTKSARALWEELKSAFNEDFGTKRSQVNKYLQFQMVDGISVIDQVQELHKIADSITASGMWVDENFHVSAIISKLPPSWKEYRVKLMQEEFLPLNKLMYHLRLEDESRNPVEKMESAHVGKSRVDNKLGPKKTDMKRPGMYWEMAKDYKFITCFKCGKNGHIARNCQYRNVYIRDERNEESEVVPVAVEANIVEGAS